MLPPPPFPRKTITLESMLMAWSKVANAAVLRLTKEAQWMAEAVAAQESLRTGADTFIDRCLPFH